jgi:HPt (histidine-containing phosphotransfer) domain-containing protein
MQAIRDSIARQDAAALQHAAHALRGSVSNFSAREAVTALIALEAMGHTAIFNGASGIYEALEVALEQMKPEFKRLTNGQGPRASWRAANNEPS